ncbi:MAG: XisI protein [Lewinellaceae bacterium]|nr:XisI protein [Saprospiraceae bacterium]MCB9339542.1 XisI protein [Lewinellaceae bacterium]
MEKVESYRRIVQQVLTDYAAPSGNPAEAQQEQLIFDTLRDHFQIMAVGWEGENRVYFTILHLDIINGKIWVQENNTDLDIAQKLEEQGVPKSDIVLAFQAPSMRKYSGYAVA